MERQRIKMGPFLELMLAEQKRLLVIKQALIDFLEDKVTPEEVFDLLSDSDLTRSKTSHKARQNINELLFHMSGASLQGDRYEDWIRAQTKRRREQGKEPMAVAESQRMPGLALGSQPYFGKKAGWTP